MFPYGLIIALATLALDQLSKYWMLHVFKLADRAPVEIMPFLNLDVVWNTGISFGMLNQFGMNNAMVLVMISVFICAALFGWLHKVQEASMARAIGFVLGGALGNIIDRYRFGSVFDFIDLHLGNWHWPAFNVADAAICLGVFLILINGVWQKLKSTM